MGYIDVWEHFGEGGHIDADWSSIFEDLYSPELGNLIGIRGSACVEVMTTLHGSAPSLRRHAEGCVPLEGGYCDQFASAMASIQEAIAGFCQRIDGQ
ncbi:hypothetical protein CK203_056792 [Vitis vinifera]|uniref:Uncharacterized protein n=1 Tax=Vitis vinifera TaxID=29760 RepID=A0A438FVE6_VITVI|nr:hypothetical protein CK203_056792 [Vitis vinifera]